MSCWGIFLSHLPPGITEAHLKNQLQENEALKSFFLRPNLTVRVYDAQFGKKVAVVTRLCCDFEKLTFAFRDVTITSREGGTYRWGDIAVKEDTGEERGKDGKHDTTRPSHFRKEENKYSGESDRKLTGIFSQEILDAIPEKLSSGFRSMMYITSEDFIGVKREDCFDKLFHTPGHVSHRIRKKTTDNWFGLKYDIQMEYIQAIMFLNNNDAISDKNKPIIWDNDKKAEAICDFKMGLGKNGCMIDVPKAINDNQYIPWTLFDDRWLNWNSIKRIRATCFKCKSLFKIKGVNQNLNYLAGECKCDYDPSLDPAQKSPSKAIFWPGEKFTRLIPNQPFQGRDKNKRNNNDDTSPIYFDVLMEPIKKEYNSTKQYKEIFIPLLQKELIAKEKDFQRKGQDESCVIKSCEPVGSRLSTKNISSKDQVLFSIKIKMKETDLWQKDNPEVVSSVQFQSNLQDIKDVFATVFKMDASSDSKSTIVTLQAKMPFESCKTCMSPGKPVKVTAIPSTTEDKSMMVSLHEFAKRVPCNVLEEMIVAKPTSNLLLADGEIQIRKDWKEDFKQDFVKNLNPEQLMAFEKSKISKFSGIHGLPGSGKTDLLSKIVAYLSAKEEGKILVTAPSNHACDELGNKLFKNKLPHTRILRILSHSQSSKESNSNNSQIPTLKSLVMGDIKWLSPIEIRSNNQGKIEISDDDLKNIKKCVDKNTMELLTLQQRRALNNHMRHLEGIIMKDFDIIICTVGMLANGRLKEWARDENQQFTTVCLDEAAQLLHPATLFLSGFNAKRYVLAGDHEQLPPAVFCSSAVLGGLDVPLMQILHYHAVIVAKERRIAEIPWTTLTTQYRMNRSICRLVYQVTYPDVIPQDDFTFYKEICKNKSDAPWIKNVRDKYKIKNSNRIIVLDHNGKEQKVGCGYKNSEEIKTIVKAVEDFVAAGVDQTQISVVSMYDLQKRCIINELGKKGINDVNVGNTDAIQGRENDIVIISLVRNNKDSNFGFLTKANRLNVALSRARHFLVIACAFQDFYTDNGIQHWKSLARTVDCEYPKIASISKTLLQ